MFEPTSRYYSLGTKTYTGADGRIIAYVSRRFVPRGESMTLLIEVIVSQGDRLDLIAARTIGDPEQFWRICDANNAMDPQDLVDAGPGNKVRVPAPQF